MPSTLERVTPVPARGRYIEVVEDDDVAMTEQLSYALRWDTPDVSSESKVDSIDYSFGLGHREVPAYYTDGRSFVVFSVRYHQWDQQSLRDWPSEELAAELATLLLKRSSRFCFGLDWLHGLRRPGHLDL